MRPDFARYATGYRWLDWVTAPLWKLYFRWHQWRFYRYIGKGDAARGRRILREAVELADSTPLREASDARD